MNRDATPYSSPTVKHQFPNAVLLAEVERLLAEGREVVLVPKGRSMLPFIRGEADKVLLRKPSVSGLRVGDIVLARSEAGNYIMHRIIAIHDEKVILMGDGNLQGTEEVGREGVVGKVAEIITPTGHRRKPSRAWFWRKLLPIRKYLLKIYRKWNKIRASSSCPPFKGGRGN